MPNYKFDEERLLKELQEYIDNTYSQYYAQSQFQASEFVIDSGHGVGFCVGSIMKYAQRYGKKSGFNRKALWKIVHYGLMLLHVHDKFNLDSAKSTKESSGGAIRLSQEPKALPNTESGS